MKKWIVILFLCILAQQGHADVFSRRVENDLRNGQITETRAIYLEALRALDPGLLPVDLPQAALPIKCAFSLANRIRRQWEHFDPAQQAVLSRMVSRPDLPLSLVSPSGRFKIHYTTTGTNSVPLDDLDHSGVPDWAEKAAVILDSVYAVEVIQLNFKAPPKDDTDGPEWDIYIQNIPGAYGWTNPDKLLTYNPNVYTSYIELDNNYTSTPTQGLDGLRTTAAHEFFHMIQLGYNGRDDNNDGSFDDQFLMEASCTWMEDAVYNGINDYYYYIGEYFETTNIPFDRMDGWREYGLCLWFHFLAKRYGGPEVVRSIWEEIISRPALQANDRALVKRGSSFESELALYYAWNVMTGSRADTLHYYPEGNYYPEIVLDGNGPFERDTTLTSEAKYTASRYFRLTRDDGSSFTLVPVNTEWETKIKDERFTLSLINDGNHPLYTDLGDNAAGRIISNSGTNFKCTAVVEKPDQQAVLIEFGADSSDPQAGDAYACYPNPFVLKNYADVTIPFFLASSSVITVSIFNPSGYLVKRDEKYYGAAGEVQWYRWNGRNDRKELVSSGIYVAVVESETKVVRMAKLAVIQ